MANSLEQAYQDAKTLQEGLSDFSLDANALEKECPKTKLIFREIEHPDEEELDPEEPYPDDGTGDGAPDGKAAVVLTIRDYCTGDIVAGAQVSINGRSYTSAEDGRVCLGYLNSGETYPLQVTASGYTDSAADTIPNDNIVVP